MTNRLSLVIAILALLAVAFFIGLNIMHERRQGYSFRPAWPEALEDVQLTPARPALDPADVKPENAFWYIRTLSGLAADELPAEEGASGEYSDFCRFGYERAAYPLLEMALVRHANEINAAHKAAGLSDCQVPTLQVGPANQPWLTGVREVTMLLRFSAERNAFLGNWQDVLRDYRTGMKISDHITRGGLVSNYFVNYAAASDLCESMRKVAGTADMPDEISLELAGLLLDLDANLEPTADAMRFEYMVARRQVQLAFHGLPEDDTAGSRDAAVELLETIFSHLIAVCENDYADGRFRQRAMPLIDVLHNPAEARLELPEPELRSMLAVAVSRYPDLQRAQLLHETNLRGTALTLGLEAYRRRHEGALPASLRELCEEFDPCNTEDPFQRRGASFFYRTTDNGVWELRSVGPNQRRDDMPIRNAVYGYMPSVPVSSDVCFSSLEFLAVAAE